MTIALGILANDGLVIAADSEESTGYMKSGKLKIITAMGAIQLGQATRAPPTHGACAIAGAGDSGYVETLSVELVETFLNNPELRGTALKQAFWNCLKSFYKDHIIPFAALEQHCRQPPGKVCDRLSI